MLERHRTHLLVLAGQRKQELNQYRTACVTHDELEAEKADLQEALIVLQTASTLIQTKVHGRIAEVVTHCLAAIFPDPYECRITFDPKRGKTEAIISLWRDGAEFNPMNDVGCGVLDVVTFALRVCAITLQQPPVRKIMIADEPFKWVSEAYRPAVRDMMERLSKDMGFQFIIVTHIPELITGNIIPIEGTTTDESEERIQIPKRA